MRVGDKYYKTVWFEKPSLFLIDQNALPFNFRIFRSDNYITSCEAIKTMIVRGAGAIGAAAGFAMAQAIDKHQGNENDIRLAREKIENTRPTAYNLFYAVERVYNAGKNDVNKGFEEAYLIAKENEEEGRLIGEFGKELIKPGYRIETHCNAGWLGFVDYGTALSPIYLAHKEGKDIFVYVDETRPRSQGARLTAWELLNEKVPFAVIPDNAGAHYMSKGEIDMVIVGADRVAANGDAANKIGTLEKAIAAKEYNIPFYVAAPYSTIDMNCKTGGEIHIEMRNPDEVLFCEGMSAQSLSKVRIAAPGAQALNPAFDVTPAKYITAIITEKGIVNPNNESIKSLL